MDTKFYLIPNNHCLLHKSSALQEEAYSGYSPIQTPSLEGAGDAPSQLGTQADPSSPRTADHDFVRAWVIKYLLPIQNHPAVCSLRRTLLQPQWNFIKRGYISLNLRQSRRTRKRWKREPPAQVWCISQRPGGLIYKLLTGQ